MQEIAGNPVGRVTPLENINVVPHPLNPDRFSLYVRFLFCNTKYILGICLCISLDKAYPEKNTGKCTAMPL